MTPEAWIHLAFFALIGIVAFTCGAIRGYHKGYWEGVDAHDATVKRLAEEQRERKRGLKQLSFEQADRAR